MNKRAFFGILLVGVLGSVALILSGCDTAMAQGAATGTVKVKVAFQGTPPTMKKLITTADPFCAGKVVTDESVLVANGALQNAVASLDGVAGTFTPPSASVVVDQNGCHYAPHVTMMQVGQNLEVKNSDQTLHNVHAYKAQAKAAPATLEAKGTAFNRAMFQGMANIKQKIEQDGNVLKLKCDVHPWMTGYVFVSKNPFAAVSGADGAALINNVPAGAHTLKVWHEKFGEKTQQVTVTAGATAEVTITYQPGA